MSARVTFEGLTVREVVLVMRRLEGRLGPAARMLVDLGELEDSRETARAVASAEVIGDRNRREAKR